MTIPVPRLKLCRASWQNPALVPRIVTDRKPASVFNPSRFIEAYHTLREEAGLFEIRHRIRRHAAEGLAKLELILSLMAYGGRPSLCPDPAELFEAYLLLRGSEFLRDLLALLDMPEIVPKPLVLQAA